MYYSQQVSVSPDDWSLIMTAVGAYAHNAKYRDLIERLAALEKGQTR